MQIPQDQAGPTSVASLCPELRVGLLVLRRRPTLDLLRLSAIGRVFRHGVDYSGPIDPPVKLLSPLVRIGWDWAVAQNPCVP